MSSVRPGGGGRVQAVAHAPEQQGELLLLGRFERSVEQLCERQAVAHHRRLDPGQPGRGQRCKGSPAILGAHLAIDEAGVAQAVDRPGEPARREGALGSQITHAKAAGLGPHEANQHLQTLLWQVVVVLHSGHDGSPEVGGRLEDETGEYQRIAAASRLRADPVGLGRPWFRMRFGHSRSLPG